MLDGAAYTPLTAAETAPEPAPFSRIWAVVQSYPQAERWASDNLTRRGYPTYLPMRRVQIRDRTTPSLVRTVQRPLFTSYLFVELNGPWTPIRYCPGVQKLLASAGKPNICPNGTVEAIQEALQAAEDLADQPIPWKPGTPCTPILGPLRGMPAVVLSVHAGTARISLMFMGTLGSASVAVSNLKLRE